MYFRSCTKLRIPECIKGIDVVEQKDGDRAMREVSEEDWENVNSRICALGHAWRFTELGHCTVGTQGTDNHIISVNQED